MAKLKANMNVAVNFEPVYHKLTYKPDNEAHGTLPLVKRRKKLSKFDLDVLHQTISDSQSNICQAVIMKEGKLIYADTWNGYSINDTVHIASATKSVVALLVGIAIDKGYIDSLEQHILDFQ